MLATAEQAVAADQDPALAAERESSRGSRSRATQAFDAPVEIQLKADRQHFDGQRNLFVAEGNVTPSDLSVRRAPTFKREVKS